MRIVYLHQYFTTASMAGGTRSYEFARRLVRDGHDVHVVTSDRSGCSTRRKWVITDVEGVTVHAIPQAYNNSMNFGQRLAAFLGFAISASKRARSLRGDVVVATSTPLTIAIPGIAAVLGRKSNLVMEIRDLWPEVPIALGYLKNPAARFLAVALERLAYRMSSNIIALSTDMADGIRARGVEQSRIAIIPNLSDTGRFRDANVRAADFYEQHPELQNRPFVVYAGAFGQVNGVEYMASLANHYRQYDSRMAFVAIGDGARREAVAQHAEELGVLDDNFFIFDPVAKSRLPVVLAAATACSSWVIPVKELGANSANKFFDALAAGRPMIINHQGWQSHLLAETGAGVSLSATDPAAAAQVLHGCLSSEEWMEKAGQSSSLLGEEKFETEVLYEKFFRTLQSACDPTVAGSRSI